MGMGLYRIYLPNKKISETAEVSMRGEGKVSIAPVHNK
jgi:hypothetical protein